MKIECKVSSEKEELGSPIKRPFVKRKRLLSKKVALFLFLPYRFCMILLSHPLVLSLEVADIV
jgi:hypothetical protein